MALDLQIHDPPTRFVIIHYHIFKNGGSTFLSIFSREFPEGFATIHGPTDVSLLDGNCLSEILRQNPSILAISSHHLRYPKPVIPNTVVYDCCFLRHPLDRLQSIYSYFRTFESPDLLCRMASEESPKKFFRKLIDDFPHFVCNAQVTLLANRGVFTRPVDETDFQRCAGMVREMAIPGLVERFDESLVAAEYFLKPAFPKLRLEYVPQNVSRPLGGTLEERLERLRSSWGANLYETLSRLNEFDLELFRCADREITRRFSLVPEAARRIEDFRARCRRGHAGASADTGALARWLMHDKSVLSEPHGQVHGAMSSVSTAPEG